jgi:hypothetical protein
MSGVLLIQCCRSAVTGWTRLRSVATIRGMARGFHIEKLSDEFGQYTLVLKCAACVHERVTDNCHTDVATDWYPGGESESRL